MSDEEGIIRDSKLTPRFEWNSQDGITFDASREVLATYTLQVFGPADELERLLIKATVRWHEILKETEENLTDLLPPGYSAVIREWDEAEPPEPDPRLRKEYRPA